MFHYIFQVLVFTQFRSMISTLASKFNGEHWPFRTLVSTTQCGAHSVLSIVLLSLGSFYLLFFNFFVNSVAVIPGYKRLR